jgi:FkbM family methyltransferase
MASDRDHSDRLALADLLAEFLEGYTVIDVGAYGSGDVDVYAPALLKGGRVIGFEVNIDECTRLNEQTDGTRRYYPSAIGDGKPGTFHRCRWHLTSSLFRPNSSLLAYYENLAELCEVIDEDPIETVRLDDIKDIHEVDFLKIDIQGATLSALKSAPKLIARTLVIHAETEFVTIYQKEPLFSECELYLRQHRFMFHHFHRIEGRRMIAGNYIVGRAPSQMLWADAVFVPSLERLDSLGTRELARLAWTMHTIYGACDIAMACLVRCSRYGDGILASHYHELLKTYGLLA